MKKYLIAALLSMSAVGSSVALAQPGEEGRVTHEAAGDSAKAEGPGSEHHEGASPAGQEAGELGSVTRGHEVEADPTQHWNWTNIHYHGKDEYGGKYGDGTMTDEKTGITVKEEEPMSAPFVLMLLNFGILLLLLAKFGGPAARKLAQERHDEIKSALDEAARLRDQAAKKLAEYETRIKDVDTEVKKLVDGIRADAESDKKRILEAAQTQAAQMKRDAEQRIAAEIEYARKALQREVSLAATGATEKLLKDKVTGDDQNKLVSTFITNVSTGSRKEVR